MRSLCAPSFDQVFFLNIQGEQTYAEIGIVSLATIHEWGESFEATCGMPRPNATRDASTDENDAATSGFYLSISLASLTIISPLARSLLISLPPTCLLL